MAHEHALFEQGPEAILAAVAEDRATLNNDVLAQACARQMRAATTLDDATGWGTAAVACYEATAKSRQVGFDRQGSEVGLFGVMAALILTWGSAPDSEVRDPARIERWLRALTDGHQNPEQFGRALARGAETTQTEHANAVLLRERLSTVGVPLLGAGLLSASMRPWFVAAGLVET